jgi:NAD(P)-dependent dehydrogenase (short-subunit alcohol dehydrogenase family)
VAAAFAGKVALVTGVGRAGQIGHAVAQGLGRAGARLVLAGRDGAVLEGHIKAFAAEGIEARSAVGDLALPPGARAAVAAAVDGFGGLDVLVNVAGGYVGADPFVLIGAGALDDALAFNLKTTFFVSQAAVPALRARGGGAIVNFASVAALKPLRNTAAYTAAKAAVAGLTRALALELRDERIRVNALAPGTVRTADNAAQMGGDEKVRWVELDHIVAAVCYLASDAAAAVSGQILAVTAGEG